MIPADRYEMLRHECLLREKTRQLDSNEWPEHALQSHWFAGGFGREFTTRDGRKVEVVQFGVWNHEAGPDFIEAAVRIDDGEPQRGSIELDPDARDWERHGHARNPAYEDVVLHVFAQSGEAEFFTRTAAHRNVPQVQLNLDLLDEPMQPPLPAIPGLCVAPLRAMREARVREVLLAAAQYRLRRKAAAIQRNASIHGKDEALYQALASTLGYKANKQPFTLLAQRLPLRLLRSRREDAAALLFGLAGFLQPHGPGELDAATRGYLRALWERWWPLRTTYERLTIPPALWSLAGQRPVNHPQRRLAALVQIIQQWPKVRSLWGSHDGKAVSAVFKNLSDSYWDHHYTVTSRPAAERMALVGESRVNEILVNVFLPVATQESSDAWAIFEALPAKLGNRRAETAAQRLFGDCQMGRTLLKSAAMQQGLLQIYEDFCQRDSSDCRECLFPSQIEHW